MHRASESDIITSGVKKNKRSKIRYFIAGGGCVLILLLVALCFVWPAFFEKSPGSALIKIPKNASRETVVDSISKYLGEEYASGVKRAFTLRGSDFSRRHGAYMIDSGMTPLMAERKLSAGAQHPIRITINGCRGLDILSSRLSSKLDLPEDSLLSYVSEKTTAENYGLTKEQMLGLFIDDTYEVYWNVSPEKLTEKIGNHYRNVWNEERRTKAKALGLTPEEVMILVSIVDEETIKMDDKGKIGRLYINRLNKGMKLQADPTVKFALGDFSLRRIRSKHLSTESPYNTYLYAGLPPGPIRTVSVADIDAVLDSSPNNYLYMCAKDDFSGYHVFATTYTEHLKNARKYQQALNRRGIK